MAEQVEQAGAATTTYGQHWQEADRVEAYAELNRRQETELKAVYRIMVELTPFAHDAPIRVLDIGAGYGAIAEAFLDAFPNAKAVGLDFSEPMMDMGLKQMSRFGDRFGYHVGDFSSGTLPSGLEGKFDVIVSSRAIHHLPPDNKRVLFADIYARLNDGGCFLDLDNTRPQEPLLRERYAEASPDAALRALVQQSRPPGGGGREFPDPVGNQLTWLREAGFAPVDCFWKLLGRSLFGGYKNAAAPA